MQKETEKDKKHAYIDDGCVLSAARPLGASGGAFCTCLAKVAIGLTDTGGMGTVAAAAAAAAAEGAAAGESRKPPWEAARMT